MMDKDMMLAKTAIPAGWIDMGIGEASVVRQALFGVFRSLKSWSPSRKLDLSYQSPRGAPRLVQVLQDRFGSDVTVTVGAKNGLFLVFSALARMGYKRIVSDGPHWTSFPAIVNQSGLEFVVNDPEDGFNILTDIDPKTDVLLITSPNNPDGLVTSEYFTACFRDAYPDLKIIHDAVYESKAYGFEGIEDLGADVKIYSAAKQLGLSGIRIGWVVTKWKDLDLHLQDLTETITSGACVMAQEMVADIFTMLKEHPELEAKFYQDSQEALRLNREAFLKGLGDTVDPLSIKLVRERRGMFIWIPDTDLDLSAKVRIVKGSSFGMPGFIRASIGSLTPDNALRAGLRLGGKGEV